MGRRSRQRASTPRRAALQPRDAAAGARGAASSSAAHRDRTTRAAASDAPQPPWGRSRSIELCILLSIVVLGVGGLFADGDRRGVAARRRLPRLVSLAAGEVACASTSPATARTRSCWPGLAVATPRCRFWLAPIPQEIVLLVGSRRVRRGRLRLPPRCSCVASGGVGFRPRDRTPRALPEPPSPSAARRMQPRGPAPRHGDLSRPRSHDRLLPRRARPRARPAGRQRRRPGHAPLLVRRRAGHARHARVVPRVPADGGGARGHAAGSTTSRSPSARPRSRSPGATTCASAACRAPRSSSAARFRSIYFRDPDGNLSRSRRAGSAAARPARAGPRRGGRPRSDDPPRAAHRPSRPEDPPTGAASAVTLALGQRPTVFVLGHRDRLQELAAAGAAPAPLAHQHVGDRHAGASHGDSRMTSRGNDLALGDLRLSSARARRTPFARAEGRAGAAAQGRSSLLRPSVLPTASPSARDGNRVLVRGNASRQPSPWLTTCLGTTSGRLLKRFHSSVRTSCPRCVRLRRVSNVCQGGRFDQGVNERNIRSERLFSSVGSARCPRPPSRRAAVTEPPACYGAALSTATVSIGWRSGGAATAVLAGRAAGRARPRSAA